MNGFTAAAARALRAGTVVVLAGMLCCATASGSGRAASAPAAGAAQAPRDVIITDVSCPSAARCVTVGNDVTGNSARPLAELWNGTTWTDTHPSQPAHATSTRVFGVSCPTRRACVAVGDYDTTADPLGRPYAQIWNGRTWKITPVPQPASHTFSGLNSVSCATARSCVAVGNVLVGEHNTAYSVVWNGRKWHLEWVRLRSLTTYSRLAGVSCTGPRSCTAAGEYQRHDSSKSRTLVETFNGREWTIRPTPNPRSGPNGSTLEGVSCWARRGCVAVGHGNKLTNDGPFTVAERLNGQGWARSPSRDLAVPATSSLMGVACASRRRCVAVGSSFSPTPTQTLSPLMETWDGTNWQIDQTPVPADAVAMTLEAVSCGAPDACMAAGYYNTSDPLTPMSSPPSIPVALTYDGTAWTLAAAP